MCIHTAHLLSACTLYPLLEQLSILYVLIICTNTTVIRRYCSLKFVILEASFSSWTSNTSIIGRPFSAQIAVFLCWFEHSFCCLLNLFLSFFLLFCNFCCLSCFLCSFSSSSSFFLRSFSSRYRRASALVSTRATPTSLSFLRFGDSLGRFKMSAKTLRGVDWEDLGETPWSLFCASNLKAK